MHEVPDRPHFLRLSALLLIILQDTGKNTSFPFRQGKSCIYSDPGMSFTYGSLRQTADEARRGQESWIKLSPASF
jgi:hypothetical protein